MDRLLLVIILCMAGWLIVGISRNIWTWLAISIQAFILAISAVFLAFLFLRG